MSRRKVWENMKEKKMLSRTPQKKGLTGRRLVDHWFRRLQNKKLWSLEAEEEEAGEEVAESGTKSAKK